jgi:gliding motility-associated-like protein
LEDENYQLIVEDGNGCKDTDEVFVFVLDDYVLEPSDVFTPNGDGTNDVWIIKNITTYPDCEVFILNRWNQTIYTTKAYKNDWDGTYSGNALPTGAYNYLIKCGNGRVYTGTVNILR